MKNFVRANSEQPQTMTNGFKARSNSVESNSDNSLLSNSSRSKSTANHVTKTPTNHMTRTWSQDSYASNQSESSINSVSSDVTRRELAGYFAMSAEARKAKFGSNFNLDVIDYPEAPDEDADLNKQMEELFEEYRKIEKGTIMEIQYEQPTPRKPGAENE